MQRLPARAASTPSRAAWRVVERKGGENKGKKWYTRDYKADEQGGIERGCDNEDEETRGKKTEA